MAHVRLREEVIKLRLDGYTYAQIKRILDVPKATLSDWLRNLPLSKEQFELLSKNRELNRELGREKFRENAKNKRLVRLKEILKKQSEEILPLSDRELFIAGLFLYWGEGSKRRGRVCISNTDPRVIIFALYWMVSILKVPREKIRILLHLYNDMDINEETSFWSKTLNIPEDQFSSPYIKKTTREGLSYKSFGHGTCNLNYFDMDWSEKIAMSIKAIAGFYGAESELFWYN